PRGVRCGGGRESGGRSGAGPGGGGPRNRASPPPPHPPGSARGSGSAPRWGGLPSPAPADRAHGNGRPPPARRRPPRAPGRRCRRLPPRDDRENPSYPLVSSASIRRRSPPLLLVLALQLEAQLAALHSDELHLGGHPHAHGRRCHMAEIDMAPTVFCPFLGKGFRASKYVARP